MEYTIHSETLLVRFKGSRQKRNEIKTCRSGTPQFRTRRRIDTEKERENTLTRILPGTIHFPPIALTLISSAPINTGKT